MSQNFKKRDYKAFGPVAKVRFRPMCEALGFEQTTATVYNRLRNDWYDFICLDTSKWGGNGFRIYYGIRFKKTEEAYYGGLSNQLERPAGRPTDWNRYTKIDIEKNASEAHEMFLTHAEPFLQSFQSKKDVGLAYLDGSSYRLERMLHGQLPRNELFIDHCCEIMNWAGLQDISVQIRNGIYKQDKKVSIFRKWFLRK